MSRIMSPTSDQPIVQFKSVSKRFPGVLALQDVSMDVRLGSCHGLVGENGAGKSTLGKILAGIYPPDTGEVLLKGRNVKFADPRDAMSAGIGIVHQELAFCENLSVAENLCLSQLPAWGPFLSRRRMIERASERLAAIEAPLDPQKRVGELPISQQQLVQIAGAIGRGAEILIFDEPTSSLSQVEAQRLFALIRRLRAQGVTSIYISHRLEEIFHLCDTVTVLRDGRVVATRPVADLDPSALVGMMIGRSLDAYFPGHLEGAPGRELLRVEGLSSPGKFESISFVLRAGEVLGLAGLVGAGRTEVADALFGLDPMAKGGIYIRGKPVSIRHPVSAMKLGLGLVPEDRKRFGLVLSMNARENITLPIVGEFARLGWVHTKTEQQLSNKFFNGLRVRAPSAETLTASLSGGNQQKVVLAKWLAARSHILIVDEPTRGVDVGAKAEIHGLIDQLAREQKGILLISSELPEIINLSTRILVLRQGRLVGELTRAQASQDTLMRLMAGVSK